MHPAIELLIARAKSHPEEFIDGKWGWHIDGCIENAPYRETAVLRRMVRALKMEGIHRSIMEQLLNPQEEVEYVNKTVALGYTITEEEMDDPNA